MPIDANRYLLDLLLPAVFLSLFCHNAVDDDFDDASALFRESLAFGGCCDCDDDDDDEQIDVNEQSIAIAIEDSFSSTTFFFVTNCWTKLVDENGEADCFLLLLFAELL